MGRDPGQFLVFTSGFTIKIAFVWTRPGMGISVYDDLHTKMASHKSITGIKLHCLATDFAYCRWSMGK